MKTVMFGVENVRRKTKRHNELALNNYIKYLVHYIITDRNQLIPVIIMLSRRHYSEMLISQLY